MYVAVQVSLTRYLAEPSADNLLALGEGRADMIAASLGVREGGVMEERDLLQCV